MTKFVALALALSGGLAVAGTVLNADDLRVGLKLDHRINPFLPFFDTHHASITLYGREGVIKELHFDRIRANTEARHAKRRYEEMIVRAKAEGTPIVLNCERLERLRKVSLAVSQASCLTSEVVADPADIRLLLKKQYGMENRFQGIDIFIGGEFLGTAAPVTADPETLRQYQDFLGKAKRARRQVIIDTEIFADRRAREVNPFYLVEGSS